MWAVLLATAIGAVGVAYRIRRKPKLSDPEALPSLLIPALTAHARSLPIPSRHTFSYPLLYAAVDIDDAERGALDGGVFSYGRAPWKKVLGLRSDGYLAQGKLGLRAKLESLLESRGVRVDQVGRVWLVTMPSYLGFEGINPLSVWYVYRKPQELLCVVLEVHNTFGEKHAYVLQHDSATAHEPAASYTHAWTFPRSFHVSPFNSREGYYRLDLLDPFANGTFWPKIKISLRLLTPARKQKLHATLMSHASRQPVSLDGGSALRLLLRYPFDLFLTTPRILYHAYKLHYEKRLLVYPRPEPFAMGETSTSWNGRQDDQEGIGGTVGWQGRSWVEQASERSVRQWARSLPLEVQFTYDRPPVICTSVDAKEKVTVRTDLPNFFTLLVGCPTVQHFLLVAQEDGHTTFSSPERFAELFPPCTAPQSQLDKLAKALRARHLAFFLSFAADQPADLSPPFASHFLPTTLKTLAILAIPYLADKAEYTIMNVVGAKFVPGREPWSIWAGILNGSAMEDSEALGSLRFDAP